MMIPKPLFPGARVALVAPASAVPEEKLQPQPMMIKSRYQQKQERKERQRLLELRKKIQELQSQQKKK